MFKETFFRRIEIQFFPWPVVEFLLYLHYLLVRKVVKIVFFLYAPSYEFVRVLYGPFLPRAVGVGKVHNDPVAAFSRQPVGDFQVGGKLAPVVRGDGLDRFPVREQQPDGDQGRWQGFAPLWQPLHQHEVGRPLGQRQYGIPAGVYNRVHLPVAEALAVGLGRAQVYARAVGDVCRLGRGQRLDTPAVLEFVWHVGGKPARRVSMDMVVDGLLADVHAGLAQYTGYLLR